MEHENRTAPLSIVEAEEFWRTGTDARGTATDPDPGPGTTKKSEALSQADGFASGAQCCAGEDVPGVGRTHSADCPRKSSPADSRRAAIGGGEAREPGRFAADAMEPLLIRLIFAANILAGKQMRVGSRRICCECLLGAELGAPVKHRHDCATGEVVRTLEALEELGGNFGREAAANVETGRAGDGIRLRVAEATRALRSAAQREMVRIPGSCAPSFQCNVCRSSVTGLDKMEWDIVHASDCWVANALLVLGALRQQGGAQ